MHTFANAAPKVVVVEQGVLDVHGLGDKGAAPGSLCSLPFRNDSELLDAPC